MGTRVLIVVFDGLRPDRVSAASMPNLDRFRRTGFEVTESRCVFPSETRVNQASLVTGALPGRHGIRANAFVHRGAKVERLIDSGRFDSGAADLIAVPTLGERLAAAGRSLAVIGSGSPGGSRLLHHRAAALGQINLSAHGAAASLTPDAAAAVVASIGPAPAAAIPNRARNAWLTEAFIACIAPRFDPDVAILWYAEPDLAYHYRGIASAEAAAALAHVDGEFGRLLAWRETSGRGADLHLIALSDHGHAATRGAPLGVARRLSRAGFRIARTPGEGGDAVLVPGRTATLHARDPETAARLARWLSARPWCDAVVAAADGAFPPAALGLAGLPAADVVFTADGDDRPGPGRVPGRCAHDNPTIPPGGGMHGGLGRFEMHNLLAMAGRRFRRGRSTLPAGIIDLAPTVLHLLGVAGEGFDGRVLGEALVDHDETPLAVTTHTVAAAGGGRVRLAEVGGARYLSAFHRPGASPSRRAGGGE